MSKLHFETAHAGKHPSLRPGHRRTRLLKWLRKTHLYLGLWGALLGLVFGVTGILLNHRSIMKIPVERVVQRNVQLPLPASPPASAKELAAWLQSELAFTPTQTPLIKSQPAKQVIWGDRLVSQPERWTVSLQSPTHGVSAEYYVGNRFVQVDHLDATLIGTLTRLHMASGVNAFWVLLSDSIAGSLILLSITGLLLWTQLNKIRLIGVATTLAAVLAALGFIASI